MTNEEITRAYELFSKRDRKSYEAAADIFIKNELTYEAGLSFLLAGNINKAKKNFRIKEKNCPASAFCIILIDIIEGKKPKEPKYFQVRAFLEVILNLLIENEHLAWVQKIIENYEFFTKANIEVPKFLARVLFANGYYDAIPLLANFAREICFLDAEIHYIEAAYYIGKNENKKALECINRCLSFSPEYYPVLKLKRMCE